MIKPVEEMTGEEFRDFLNYTKEGRNLKKVAAETIAEQMRRNEEKNTNSSLLFKDSKQ